MLSGSVTGQAAHDVHYLHLALVASVILTKFMSGLIFYSREGQFPMLTRSSLTLRPGRGRVGCQRKNAFHIKPSNDESPYGRREMGRDSMQAPAFLGADKIRAIFCKSWR